MRRAYLCTLLLVTGCDFLNWSNWSEDLDHIKSAKKSCVSFKHQYDEVKPKTNTVAINMKIKDCQEIGAWEEVTGDKDKPTQ